MKQGAFENARLAEQRRVSGDEQILATNFESAGVDDQRIALELAIRILAIDRQVAGLSLLCCVGSPRSKEGDERRDAKFDLILEKIDPQNAAKLIAELEEQSPKK